MSRIYCDTLTRPEGFEGIELFHGFNAFFSGKPYDYKFNTLMNHPERQICTSTKYLGMMGVKVTGDVLMASSYDLFSGVDLEDNGRRYFDDADIESIVYHYDDLEHHWDDDEENNEIVMTNTKITAIWVTSDASNKLKALAKELAEKHNLPLLQLGESIFC